MRVVAFCPWGGPLQTADDYLAAVPQVDLRTRVSRPDDPVLVQMGRLDRDWHAENVRALASMRDDGIEFLPAWATGIPGLADVAAGAVSEAGVETWFVISAQHPQKFAPAARRVFTAFASRGIRIFYYAYDEASRAMECFREIASFLDVLVHDENPLEDSCAVLLRPDCVRIHRSWVANFVPFEAPFVEDVEPRVVFLGSQLGLTPHRRRQIEFLESKFKDRFTVFSDHSLPVSERGSLGRRFKVSVCPEGRRFITPAMRESHTDRPFWSGCTGMVPVSEDSLAGGRLEHLHRAGLIERYSHGDLISLADACERALEASVEHRRGIYEYFNRNETIGAVVASAIRLAVPARAKL